MELKMFEHAAFGSVRVCMKDNEPWFVAKDVCDALGLERPQDSVRYLDDDERGVCLVNTPTKAVEMSVISEAGLYSLVLRSRKPEAKQFKRWITHDVLPSIRRHGGYLTQQKVEEVLSDPDTIIRLATDLKNERELRHAVEEQKALAEAQRDRAIKERTYIREGADATAMATASAAVRQRDAMADKLGEGKHWKTVKAIGWLKDVFALSKGMYITLGKRLTDLSKRMGYDTRTVDVSEFGTVKSYHVDVIEAFRLELLKDGNLMGKYRRAA